MEESPDQWWVRERRGLPGAMSYLLLRHREWIGVHLWHPEVSPVKFCPAGGDLATAKEAKRTMLCAPQHPATLRRCFSPQGAGQAVSRNCSASCEVQVSAAARQVAPNFNEVPLGWKSPVGWCCFCFLDYIITYDYRRVQSNTLNPNPG